jgi:hypothetical protein
MKTLRLNDYVYFFVTVISSHLIPKEIKVTINREAFEIYEIDDSIKLKCAVTGLFTELFWQFNDTLIPNTELETTLIIEKAARNNTGRYTCIAQNDEESASASVDVVVNSDLTTITTTSTTASITNFEDSGIPESNHTCYCWWILLIIILIVIIVLAFITVRKYLSK